MSRGLFRFWLIWGLLFGILLTELGAWLANNNMFAKAEGAKIVFAIMSLSIGALSLALTCLAQYTTEVWAKKAQTVHVSVLVCGLLTLSAHGWHFADKSIFINTRQVNEDTTQKSIKSLEGVAGTLTKLNETEIEKQKLAQKTLSTAAAIQRTNNKFSKKKTTIAIPEMKSSEPVDANKLVAAFTPKLIEDSSSSGEAGTDRFWAYVIRILHTASFLISGIGFAFVIASVGKYFDLNQNNKPDSEEEAPENP